MLFKSLTLGLSLLAGANAAVLGERGFSSDYCHADYCLRALRASQIATRLSAASSDCSQFLKQTYTPTQPVYVTATSRATTSVAIATSTSYEGGSYTRQAAQPVRERDLEERAEPTIPAYASPCSGAVRFTSACSCIGVGPWTVTAPSPTSTVTATDTVSYTTTVTSTLELYLTKPTAIGVGSVDDYSYQSPELPFDIEMYTIKSNQPWFSTNGFFSLSSPVGSSYLNTQLPNIDTGYSGLPFTSICPYWDDLGIYTYSLGHGIFYEVRGEVGSRVVIFEYFGGLINDVNRPIHWYVVYEEANPNVMEIHYLNMGDTGTSATIGAQNGLTFVQYGFDQAGKVNQGTVLILDTIANTMTLKT